MNRVSRNEVIDGFRGLSIIGVVTYHYLVRYAPQDGLRATYAEWIALGKFGVEIFFVISGLVITMTVLRSRNAIDFAVRRAARLAPAFFVMCTVTFLFTQLYDPLGFRVGLSDYLLNLTFVGSSLGARYVDGVYWSLAIEAKFYAFVAISFVIFKRRFWIGLSAAAAIGAVLMVANPTVGSALFIGEYFPLFLIGVGAWLYLNEGQRRTGGGVAILGLALYAVVGSNIGTELAPQLAVHFVILGATTLMILGIALYPAMRMGPLAWIGRLSYSLYLLHNVIGVSLLFALTQAGVSALAAFAIVTAAMIAAAYCSSQIIEVRGKRLVLSLWERLETIALRPWQPRTTNPPNIAPPTGTAVEPRAR